MHWAVQVFTRFGQEIDIHRLRLVHLPVDSIDNELRRNRRSAWRRSERFAIEIPCALESLFLAVVELC